MTFIKQQYFLSTELIYRCAFILLHDHSQSCNICEQGADIVFFVNHSKSSFLLLILVSGGEILPKNWVCATQFKLIPGVNFLSKCRNNLYGRDKKHGVSG